VKSEGSIETATSEGHGALQAVLAVALVGLLFTLIAPFAIGPGTRLGVAIGSGIAVLNLVALSLVVRGFVRGNGLPWGIVGALKLAVLLFAAFIVLKNQWATALSLAMGFASMPFGIVLSQLVRTSPTRRES
jgi:hypothetical protein